MPSQKKAILIAGSGKCGTSTVAHSFFASGFPMGKEEDMVLLPGSKGNIRGYWEHAAVQNLNRAILAANHADWFRPPARLPLTLSRPLRSKMAALAGSVPDGFCCKDPRLAWTADLWAEFFSEVTIVACFRNPAGFARSAAYVRPDLYTPDVVPRDAGAGQMAIWQSANRRLLELAGRYRCHWFCFDAPVEEMKARLAGIIGALGREFNEAAFLDFFLPEERRFSSTRDLRFSESGAFQEIGETYQRLLEAYRRPVTA